MRWTHDCEVAVVEGGDAGDAEAFGDGDQAGVGAAEAEVGVGLDEFTDAGPVVWAERFDGEVAVDDRRVERGFGVWAEFSVEEVGGFGDDEGGGDERPGVVADYPGGSGVVAVGAVGGRDDDAGIDDQHRSVASEAVVEELVETVGDAVLGCADRDERGPPAGPGRLGGQVRGEFGDDVVDADLTAGRFGFEATQRFGGEIDGHRHRLKCRGRRCRAGRTTTAPPRCSSTWPSSVALLGPRLSVHASTRSQWVHWSIQSEEKRPPHPSPPPRRRAARRRASAAGGANPLGEVFGRGEQRGTSYSPAPAFVLAT